MEKTLEAMAKALVDLRVLVAGLVSQISAIGELSTENGVQLEELKGMLAKQNRQLTPEAEQKVLQMLSGEPESEPASEPEPEPVPEPETSAKPQRHGPPRVTESGKPITGPGGIDRKIEAPKDLGAVLTEPLKTNKVWKTEVPYEKDILREMKKNAGVVKVDSRIHNELFSSIRKYEHQMPFYYYTHVNGRATAFLLRIESTKKARGYDAVLDMGHYKKGRLHGDKIRLGRFTGIACVRDLSVLLWIVKAYFTNERDQDSKNQERLIEPNYRYEEKSTGIRFRFDGDVNLGSGCKFIPA